MNRADRVDAVLVVYDGLASATLPFCQLLYVMILKMMRLQVDDGCLVTLS